MITIQVFDLIDVKKTAKTVSGQLNDNQEVWLEFDPRDRLSPGKARAIARGVRIPDGTRVEEHWPDCGGLCTMKLIRR